MVKFHHGTIFCNRSLDVEVGSHWLYERQCVLGDVDDDATKVLSITGCEGGPLPEMVWTRREWRLLSMCCEAVS